MDNLSDQIGYYSSKNDNDTFATFTNTLEKWNSLECRVQLPMLESLILHFDCRSGSKCKRYGMPFAVPIDPIIVEDLFRNYIAISKLLLKYKKTLKEVQIERVFPYYLFSYSPFMFQRNWTEMERGLEALDELNLNRLRLSTIRMPVNATITGISRDCGIVIDVLGRPKNIKNILFSYLINHYNNWWPLTATLSSFNNVDQNLKSVKISLVVGEFPDPTFAINLGGLSGCRNLRTLEINVSFPRIRAQLFVRNIERLPTGISILHFESPDEHRQTMGKEILVNQQQLRWIIDHLRELESFRISLVVPDEQNNENENNEEVEAAAVADDNDNAQAQVVQQQEEVNRLANVNLDTFRDLITMPNLKYLKVDLLTARALRFPVGHWGLAMGNQQGHGTTLDAIREYSDLCQAAGYTTTTTTSTNFGPDNVFGFATLLAIQRNEN